MAIGISNSTIESLTVSDLSIILSIEQQVYPFPWSEQVMRDCLQGPYLCRGLYVESTLVAYGILTVAIGECHILNICVSAEYQGQGIASVFLGELLDEAKIQHAEIAFLEVRASNVVALALYSKLGFSEIGCRKAYYRNGKGREDALVLSLPLR